MEERESWDYDSGPFCKHWSEVGCCEECDHESESYQQLRDALIWALTYGTFECAQDNPLHAAELTRARALIAQGSRP